MRSCDTADCFPERQMVVSKKVRPSPESTCTPPVRASVRSASFQGWMSERSRVEPLADRTSPRGANQGISEAGMLRRWLQGRVQPPSPKHQPPPLPLMSCTSPKTSDMPAVAADPPLPSPPASSVLLGLNFLLLRGGSVAWNLDGRADCLVGLDRDRPEQNRHKAK